MLKKAIFLPKTAAGAHKSIEYHDEIKSTMPFTPKVAAEKRQKWSLCQSWLVYSFKFP